MGEKQESTVIDDSTRWLATHFKEAASESRRLFSLVILTTNGINALIQLPKIGNLIKKMSTTREGHDLADALINDMGMVKLAKRESKDGYPITYSQFAVDIWGLLEASVRNLVAKWLENKTESMQLNAISSLKVKVGDYERNTGTERFQFIVKSLERDQSSSLKSGVDRFESLLSCVELDGPIPDSLKRTLFELSQLRNCIVHNARRADDQLIKKCPWLELRKGENIRPNFEQIDSYRKAFIDYQILLFGRALKRMNNPAAEETIAQVFEGWS